MRRKSARPYGQSTSMMRLVSMIMALAVLWALYRQFKDPSMWRILFDRPEVPSQEEIQPKLTTDVETVIDGPDDRNEDEAAEIETLFELVTDKTPLKTREMEAYWKLMEWSRSQPFTEFEKRAKSDVPFTQLWDQPDKYRGKPIRLRLHVRRVLEYDAPENPLNVTKSYEAWGWTDESRSFPYVVVFTEPPKNLPIGTDVRAEVDFVGYFLKVMTYTAFDNARGAPLLVGRARLASLPKSASRPRTDWTSVIVLLIAGITVVGYLVWSGTRSKVAASRSSSLPSEWAALPPGDETLPYDNEQTVNISNEHSGDDLPSQKVDAAHSHQSPPSTT